MPPHLITPKQIIPLAIFEAVPNTEELLDTVIANMVGNVLTFFPRERYA